tara:strand:+ start:5083 stop:5289 length:207 start_codon:yes stop_codon:yes gene_type:complete
MDPAQLKKNFEEQIASTVKQITELEANLTKAKEYKIKLEGGLETLVLLEEKPAEGGETPAPAPETPAE